MVARGARQGNRSVQFFREAPVRPRSATAFPALRPLAPSRRPLARGSTSLSRGRPRGAASREEYTGAHGDFEVIPERSSPTTSFAEGVVAN